MHYCKFSSKASSMLQASSFTLLVVGVRRIFSREGANGFFQNLFLGEGPKVKSALVATYVVRFHYRLCFLTDYARRFAIIFSLETIVCKTLFETASLDNVRTFSAGIWGHRQLTACWTSWSNKISVLFQLRKRNLKHELFFMTSQQRNLRRDLESNLHFHANVYIT